MPEKEGEKSMLLYLHPLYVWLWHHIWCGFEGLPSGGLFDFFGRCVLSMDLVDCLLT